jgi:hypothetical protein
VVQFNATVLEVLVWLIPWKSKSFPTGHVIHWAQPEQWQIALYQGLFFILLSVQCQKKYLAYGVAVEHGHYFLHLRTILVIVVQKNLSHLKALIDANSHRPSFLAEYYICFANL